MSSLDCRIHSRSDISWPTSAQQRHPSPNKTGDVTDKIKCIPRNVLNYTSFFRGDFSSRQQS